MESFQQMPIKRNERNPWTKKEDQRLTYIKQMNADKKWNEIAILMGGRSGKQCRERWVTYLSPEVVNSPWTEQEDIMLTILCMKYGKKWSTISRKLNGRTTNAIKNRYFLLERRREKNMKAEKLEKKFQQSVSITAKKEITAIGGEQYIESPIAEITYDNNQAVSTRTASLNVTSENKSSKTTIQQSFIADMTEKARNINEFSGFRYNCSQFEFEMDESLFSMPKFKVDQAETDLNKNQSLSLEDERVFPYFVQYHLI